MLSAPRLRTIGSKLMMLHRQHRLLLSPFHLTASFASDRQLVTNYTKAVIFDMGGVLLPSPLPFMSGK